MEQKQVISPGQLLTMIVLFEFGTALVIPIGLQAGQSTWLSTLLALPGGIALYILYTYFLREFPKDILSGYIRRVVGRVFGTPICILYLAFFLFGASRNLREAGDLLMTAAYDRTPLFVIHFVMITAVIYVLSKGVEVFYRLGQIYFVILFCLGAISILGIVCSGIVDMKNLLPIRGEGWGSVLHGAYPHIWLFPFGEAIAFTTVFPLLNKPSLARKSGIIALIIAGAFLSFTHAIQVAVLGADIYKRATFPLFTAISMVNIADFLQRMDALVLLTLIIGVFFKMSVHCYAVMAIASDLFNLSDERKLALPVGIVVLFGSMTSAWNFPGHAEEGETGINYVLSTACAIIPAFLWMVHLVRKRIGH
ncbi:spore gernimation protein GerB [Paenibacillus antri]|uniref:Spore gernimation protein GerB n=1 Tax=Paenibacillus antri TaxID=2582848 RepID=A0A5R9G789_9BACL|nr:GerAB/ArcD/ProY family transporter [Paenibacillus antri]TLS52282.1 spore gernimation protein GerB [Paenibacillus antri]